MAVGSSLDNNPNKSVVLTEEKVDEIEGKSEHIWHNVTFISDDMYNTNCHTIKTIVNCKEIMWHNVFKE